MKSRETAMRLKRFEADEKSRNVLDLEAMIRDFEAMAHDLQRQIQAEEDRTGVKDPAHFSYSTFAKSAGQRLSNLETSISGLREKLDAAVKDRDDALEQADKAQDTAERAAGGSSIVQRGRERGPGMTA